MIDTTLLEGRIAEIDAMLYLIEESSERLHLAKLLLQQQQSSLSSLGSQSRNAREAEAGGFGNRELLQADA